MYPSFRIPKHYFLGDRFLSVIHARIRNNCSNLNDDLFNNHISNNRSCTCGNPIEDAEHFFFECSKYNAHRLVLFNETRDFHPINLDTLLYGRSSLSLSDNAIIFSSVQKYIKQSVRFQSR